MGREIRRVPKDWEHPRDDSGRYQPLFDNDYDSAAQEWIDGLMKWERGEDENFTRCRYYWDWEGMPPDEKYYRPKWTTAEATHYQVYEDVTEGTPVSPVFESLHDLVEWLVMRGHSRKAVEHFAKYGHVLSAMVIPGVGIKMGIDALEYAREKTNDSII